MENAQTFSEDEFLLLVQTFFFFNFFEKEKIFTEMFERFSDQCHTFSFNHFARILMIFSSVESEKCDFSHIVEVLENKITSVLTHSHMDGHLELIGVYDIYHALLKIQINGKLEMKWTHFLLKKLIKNFSSLSSLLQISLIWHVAFLKPDLIHCFEVFIQNITEIDVIHLCFFERYMLNNIRFFAGKSFSLKKSEIDHDFLEKIKNFEINQICFKKIDVLDFDKFLDKYVKAISNKFPDEIVTTHKFVTTENGNVFYVPIYLEKQDICLLFLNDLKSVFSEINFLLSGKQWILQESGFDVKSASMTQLISFYQAEDVPNLEEFDRLRRDIVDEIFDE